MHLACGRGTEYERIAIAPLIPVLDEVGASWEVEFFDFDSHEEVSRHFPEFLLRWTGVILGQAGRPIPPSRRFIRRLAVRA